MMPVSPKRTAEFKVAIDIALPSEALQRIERAMQTAVLAELATIDVADGYSVRMHAPTDEAVAKPRADAPADLLGGLITLGLWILPPGEIPPNAEIL